MQRIVKLAVCSIVLISGCKMLGGGDKSSAVPSTMPATMPTTMGTTKQSLMDQAKALMQKGEALLAKGKVDNNPDEQSQGQSLIDQAKALLDKAKAMM
jgi:hypothetical protein